MFRVELAAGAHRRPPVVVKFYRRDPGDARDRLAAEFGGLEFLWENGVRAIARPLAADRDRYCGIYEFIDGAAHAGKPSARDIEQAVAFLRVLKSLRTRPGGDRQPPASEAEFSIAGIAENVGRRLERLRRCADTDDGAVLKAWVEGTLQPLVDDVLAWCERAAAETGQPFDGEIDRSHRTLSPSDFGFHNAIRRADGTLAFVDFEYFGWDDPAKTAADFVLHPGMALEAAPAHQFVDGFLETFADMVDLPARLRIVYPLFGVKWCLILLNEFLPERTGTADGPDRSAVRRRQLEKADAMAARIRREYRANPFV